MTDIVERLRALPDTRPEPEPFEIWRDALGLALVAAGEIERLRAELDALRKALEIIAAQHSGTVASTARADCMASIAALALRYQGTPKAG